MKNILVVVAHPDDEAIGCLGTLLKYKKMGSKINILYMADGHTSREEVNEVRETSAQKFVEKFGFDFHSFLSFPDNKMDSCALLDIVKEIETVISDIEPDCIFTHHGGDLNIDHQVVSRAVLTACRPQPGFCVKKILAFETLSSTEWSHQTVTSPFLPNIFFDITNEIEEKMKLLSIYEDEMRNPPHSRSLENIRHLASVRGASVGVDSAEAFQLIREIN